MAILHIGHLFKFRLSNVKVVLNERTWPIGRKYSFRYNSVLKGIKRRTSSSCTAMLKK